MGLDDRGFDSRQELGIFLFATASRPALGPTQPPIQWVPEALSLGVKRPGHEADQSPPSSAEVNNALHSPNMSSSRAALIKAHYSKSNFQIDTEAWVFKKRNTERPEAAKVKFL
jgi:hypothetical protein